MPCQLGEYTYNKQYTCVHARGTWVPRVVAHAWGNGDGEWNDPAQSRHGTQAVGGPVVMLRLGYTSAIHVTYSSRLQVRITSVLVSRLPMDGWIGGAA